MRIETGESIELDAKKMKRHVVGVKGQQTREKSQHSNLPRSVSS